MDLKKYDIENIREYLEILTAHVDTIEREEAPVHDLDIMSDALVALLIDLGYGPEDCEMEA